MNQRVAPSTQQTVWPKLPAPDDWQETLSTLHLWTQVVGKIRLEQTPWVNHSWHVPLYITPRGLTTSAMHQGPTSFEIEFDFVDHRLRMTTSAGERRSFALRPMSVATFYDKTIEALAELGLQVDIWPMPVEIPDPIEPLDEDETHDSYDPTPVGRFWRALVQINRVFNAFRARFVGKASPVHLFWGAFDVAATRFSGREAPTHPGGAPNCADWVMEEAYSKELSSAGFWPGGGFGEPAFYSYAYPEPDGFAEADVDPSEAFYLEDLGEFVLPYEKVRESTTPDETLTTFLQTTYEATADLGDWDREALENG